jgi:hypothetical protein
MKKLLSILAIFILLGTIFAIAVPAFVLKTPIKSSIGTFSGEIGYIKSKEWYTVGLLSGTFQQKNKFYRFNGTWEIIEGNYSGTTGTVFGFFGKNLLLGKITLDESGKKAPIIGFIGFNQSALKFGGRFISVIGPALYFKGTYQEG